MGTPRTTCPVCRKRPTPYETCKGTTLPRFPELRKVLPKKYLHPPCHQSSANCLAPVLHSAGIHAREGKHLFRSSRMKAWRSPHSFSGTEFLAAYFSSLSRKWISIPPSWNAAFCIRRRCSAMVVLIGSILNSRSARSVRTIASRRVGALTISLPIMLS